MVASGAPAASDDTQGPLATTGTFRQSAAERLPRVPSLRHAACSACPSSHGRWEPALSRSADCSRPTRRSVVDLPAPRRTRAGPCSAGGLFLLAGLLAYALSNVVFGLASGVGRSVSRAGRAGCWERVSRGLRLCPSWRTWRPATAAGGNTDGSKRWVFAAPSWGLSWASDCFVRSLEGDRNRRRG